MTSAERVVICALAAALAGCAGAKYQPPKDRYNTIDTGGQFFGPEEKWKEGEVTIPAFPQEADLLPFDIAGPAESAYYVDARSISIGKDGVVRYTLVARNPAGVENISYEGIHCKEREWKPYAFGRRDGTWAPAREAAWQRVAQTSVENFRFTLYRTYFCPEGFPRRKAQEAIAEIRRQYRAGPLHEGR
jgi:hypothetical protein